MPDGDHGDQPERTRLAWRRTTLAATAVTLLAVSRVVIGDPHPWALVGAALVVLGWLAVLGVAHRRIRSLTAPPARDRPPPPVAVPPGPAGAAPATLALLIATLAVLGTLLVG